MVVIIVLSSIPVMIAALGLGTASLPENFERHELHAGAALNAHYDKQNLSDHAETLRPRRMFRQGPATALSSTGSQNVSQDSMVPGSVPNRVEIATETSHSNIIDLDTDVASSVMSTYKHNITSNASLKKKELRIVTQTSNEAPAPSKTRKKTPTPSQTRKKVPIPTQTSNEVPKSSQTRKEITVSSRTSKEQKTDGASENITDARTASSIRIVARNSSRLRNIANRVHHDLGNFNIFDPAPRILSVPDANMADDCSISASAKLLAEQLARATQQKVRWWWCRDPHVFFFYFCNH